MTLPRIDPWRVCAMTAIGAMFIALLINGWYRQQLAAIPAIGHAAAPSDPDFEPDPIPEPHINPNPETSACCPVPLPVAPPR